MSLAMSEATYSVRCNSDQLATVEKLQAGVFLVHGPPGTGAPPPLALTPPCPQMPCWVIARRLWPQVHRDCEHTRQGAATCTPSPHVPNVCTCTCGHSRAPAAPANRAAPHWA